LLRHRPVGGVDSHNDTIHVAVNTGLGPEVDDREFPTCTAGYRRAVAWLIGHGPLQAVGIEGTSSYGVGITAAVTAAGIGVVEVNRTRPAERRKRGKTDRLDAYRRLGQGMDEQQGSLPCPQTSRGPGGLPRPDRAVRPPDYSDLRPARRAQNLTLTAAAAQLGVWPARIGELELGRRPNDELAARYPQMTQRRLTLGLRSVSPHVSA
jgi:Transposase